MLLAPLDSQALAKPVASAVASGIPVVIMDSALKSDKYLSYVSTDNYKGGVLAAEYLGKLLEGKGNVVLFPKAEDRIGESLVPIQTRERQGGLLRFYFR